jgi:hypothetical protein
MPETAAGLEAELFGLSIPGSPGGLELPDIK